MGVEVPISVSGSLYYTESRDLPFIHRNEGGYILQWSRKKFQPYISKDKLASILREELVVLVKFLRDASEFKTSV